MTTETRRTLPEPNDPVKEPIINSPFETPQWRWQLDTSTKAYAPALLGRRESQNIPPVAGSRKLRTTQALPGGMGARWIPLKLVNDIRTTVLGWQEDGYPGITQTSRDLINHWTDEEACQLYFAQLDAMLTHIYLNEAATNQIREEIQGINDQYNEGIHRIAHKMATATGKTPRTLIELEFKVLGYEDRVALTGKDGGRSRPSMSFSRIKNCGTRCCGYGPSSRG